MIHKKCNTYIRTTDKFNVHIEQAEKLSIDQYQIQIILTSSLTRTYSLRNSIHIECQLFTTTKNIY